MNNKIITAEEFDNILENLPYFSREIASENIYNAFKKLRADIIAEADDPDSVFSKVSGIWYMSGLDFGEGVPQLFAKTSIKINTADRSEFVRKIHSCVNVDIVYDYEESIIKGDTLVQGTRDLLLREFTDGKVYTIFDKQRDL